MDVFSNKIATTGSFKIKASNNSTCIGRYLFIGILSSFFF